MIFTNFFFSQNHSVQIGSDSLFSANCVLNFINLSPRGVVFWLLRKLSHLSAKCENMSIFYRLPLKKNMFNCFDMPKQVREYLWINETYSIQSKFEWNISEIITFHFFYFYYRISHFLMLLFSLNIRKMP